MTEHVLYRFYSRGGRLLYVGITMNPFTRFADHRRTQKWWSQVASIDMTDWDDRDQLKMMERHAIETEHPLYNIAHSRHNADWVDYTDYCQQHDESHNGLPLDTRTVPHDMYISNADGRVFAEFRCTINPEHEFFCTFGLDAPIASTLRHEECTPDIYSDIS